MDTCYSHIAPSKNGSSDARFHDQARLGSDQACLDYSFRFLHNLVFFIPISIPAKNRNQNRASLNGNM